MKDGTIIETKPGKPDLKLERHMAEKRTSPFIDAIAAFVNTPLKSVSVSGKPFATQFTPSSIVTQIFIPAVEKFDIAEADKAAVRGMAEHMEVMQKIVVGKLLGEVSYKDLPVFEAFPAALAVMERIAAMADDPEHRELRGFVKDVTTAYKDTVEKFLGPPPPSRGRGR
jgi:hypothetical protein